MANEHKVAVLKGKLEYAEAHAERQRRQIEWLAGVEDRLFRQPGWICGKAGFGDPFVFRLAHGTV